MPEHPSVAPTSDPLELELTERVAPLARRYAGLAVGMVVGDAAATVGFGRTAEGGVVPDGRTSFQIGSVTKVFTALLLADAVHRGEVDLDAPLVSLFPETATHPAGRPITLVDLATHCSGLPRLPTGLWRQALRHRSDPYASFTHEGLVAALARTPKRPPTARARYSNFGTGALGEALARAAGSTYEQLVTTRIATPLGMRDTGVSADHAAAVVATGHTRRGTPTCDWHLPVLAGAGALRSSATDLLTFLGAHLHPDTAPWPAALRTVMEPRRPAGRHLQVALGWHVLEQEGRGPVWWHNGGTGGFCSFVGMNPAEGTAVAVLTNSARSVDRIGMLLLSRSGRRATE
jgi:D-alanyl-D-alanine-carboxypeptidase/D-alanyl-D-alanine-endopeptidase